MSKLMNDTPDVIERIKQQIDTHPILLYMKGTPQFPQCGFSSQAVQALAASNARFAYVNILEEPEIRQQLPVYAQWPTFPQLYINGELVGGCDIVVEMYQNGELQKMVDEAMAQAPEAS